MEIWFIFSKTLTFKDKPTIIILYIKIVERRRKMEYIKRLAENVIKSKKKCLKLF